MGVGEGEASSVTIADIALQSELFSCKALSRILDYAISCDTDFMIIVLRYRVRGFTLLVVIMVYIFAVYDSFLFIVTFSWFPVFTIAILFIAVLPQLSYCHRLTEMVCRLLFAYWCQNRWGN